MGATPTFPATDMLLPAWMTARVQDICNSFRFENRRVCATIWWYSASSVLVDGPIRSAVQGAAVTPTLTGATCFLIPGGYLGGIEYPNESAVETDLGASFSMLLTPLIDAISEVSGTTARSLWAITTDSIANCALAVTGAQDFALGLVQEMRDSGTVMPLPRFVSTEGGLSTQRASCCLIHETPAGHMCRSCPKGRLPRL